MPGTLEKTNNQLSRPAIDTKAPVTEPNIYDTHGNMTRMPHLGDGSPEPNMFWDYRDRLIRAELGGGGTGYYVYGSNGQRVRKIWEKSANRRKRRASPKSESISTAVKFTAPTSRSTTTTLSPSSAKHCT